MVWPNVGPGVVSMRRLGCRKGVPIVVDCKGGGGAPAGQDAHATNCTFGWNPLQETALEPQPPPPRTPRCPPAETKGTGGLTVVVAGVAQLVTCCRLTVGGFVGVTVAAWPQTVPVVF